MCVFLPPVTAAKSIWSQGCAQHGVSSRRTMGSPRPAAEPEEASWRPRRAHLPTAPSSVAMKARPTSGQLLPARPRSGSEGQGGRPGRSQTAWPAGGPRPRNALTASRLCSPHRYFPRLCKTRVDSGMVVLALGRCAVMDTNAMRPSHARTSVCDPLVATSLMGTCYAHPCSASRPACSLFSPSGTNQRAPLARGFGPFLCLDLCCPDTCKGHSLTSSRFLVVSPPQRPALTSSPKPSASLSVRHSPLYPF